MGKEPHLGPGDPARGKAGAKQPCCPMSDRDNVASGSARATTMHVLGLAANAIGNGLSRGRALAAVADGGTDPPDLHSGAD